MASVGAIWGPPTLRLLRVAVANTTKVVRMKLATAARPLQGQFQHVPVRTGFTGRQPIHPAALLKQQKRGAKWFSTTVRKNFDHVLRRFVSLAAPSGKTARFDRSKLPQSNTSRRVARFSGRAPFAATLRPNLTGGAMPRTAGGYSLGGGGARYFSHTPTSPAQVVHNVSQAMRAFFVSGQKLRYDGIGPHGNPQYRAVSNFEDAAMHMLSASSGRASGAFVDFQLSPTLTALSPLGAAINQATSDISGFKAVGPTLNAEGFLDLLSADFGRALKDLRAVYADLRRLSVLGDLPVTLENDSRLRVRFPGVDADTVQRLCDDVGIQRGLVGQDDNFDAAVGATMALRFPFPAESEKTITSPGGSARSLEGHELEEMSLLDDDSFIREAFLDEMGANPWLLDTEAYGSLSPPVSSAQQQQSEFEGLEGIYRFLEECDRAKGRVGTCLANC